MRHVSQDQAFIERLSSLSLEVKMLFVCLSAGEEKEQPWNMSSLPIRLGVRTLHLLFSLAPGLPRCGSLQCQVVFDREREGKQ